MGAETVLPRAGRGAAGGPGCEVVSVGLHLTETTRAGDECLRARLVWAGQRALCALHSSSPGGDPQATCNSPGGGLRPTSAPPGSAWHVPSLLWASAAPTVRRAAGLHGGLALLWPGTLGGAGARLQRGVGIKRLDPRVLGRKLAMEDGAGQAWGRGAGWAWRRAQWTAGRPCVPEWTTGLAA